MMLLTLLFLLPFAAEGMVTDPCAHNPCGTNAQCHPSNYNRAVCSCPPGYFGNALSYCQRGECQNDYECSSSQSCKDYRCINACSGKCGVNAECNVRNHVPVCSCPPGYTGDPIVNCRRFDPEELCHPSPCGQNTKCEVINGVPTCSCLPGYIGSPLAGCRHECQSDYDCDSSKSCQNFRCRNACETGICAPNAICEVHNHRPVCTCPKGLFGDPSISCKAECETHAHCARDRPSCLNGRCINPCEGVCGINANCEVNGLKAVCSCPRDMTGDPFVRCRPFVPDDLCDPNPCGENAKCTPGHDDTGKERPVCTCYPGYLGNPLTYCRKGECSSDVECRSDQICLNYECKPACINQCGIDAICTPKQHAAVCSCPPGYTGNAIARCYPESGKSARYYKLFF